MVEIGESAPSVPAWRTNPSSDPQKNFELKEAYSKPTVLYFFPAAFTGVCTKSSCELRDDIKEFESLNAQLFGISVDLPFTQAKFMELNELNYPLLSDANYEISKAFGVLDEGFAGVFKASKRSLFLIKDGKVAYKWVADEPGNYPPFDELKSVLSE